MIKRYIRFAVKGFREGVNGGKVQVMETGLCDARLDPLAVAMKRNGKLAGCERVMVKTSQAFSVAVDGNRSKSKADVQITKLMREALGLDVPEGVQKTKVFWNRRSLDAERMGGEETLYGGGRRAGRKEAMKRHGRR